MTFAHSAFAAIRALCLATPVALSLSSMAAGQPRPLPTKTTGIFVISPNQDGLVEQTTACPANVTTVATRSVDSTLWYLCSTDPGRTSPNYQKTMDATWANPAVAGVFIRLKWSDLQPSLTQFDDTILLREVDQAVTHGKSYSLAIKSGAEGDATPAWLFEPAPVGAGLTPVVVDWDEDTNACRLNSQQAYGDPTDPAYRRLYLDMLSHVATLLKQDRARWQALSYIKVSGANAHSAENRLPNGCKVGRNCICNDQRWAEAGYTPSGLYRFYAEQMRRILREFPGKTLSYPLIQAGFPRVNDEHCYLDHAGAKVCPRGVDTRMVGPFEQTETIIEQARALYGDGVAIAHLGLGPLPDFSDPALYAPGTGCPLPCAPDGTLAHGVNGVGSGCPNKWVTDVGSQGGLTHFQTVHAPGVATPAQLSAALENLWQNSNAAMLEIYENRAWEAGDSILDTTLPVDEQRRLSDWNQRLQQRALAQ